MSNGTPRGSASRREAVGRRRQRLALVAASEPTAPGARGQEDPGTRSKGPPHKDTAPRDRPIVTSAPSAKAVAPLEPPAPVSARAAGRGTPLDVALALLPERSAGGMGGSVQAAAAGISGSLVALVGLLLVAFSLVFRSVLSAVPPPRPLLYSFALQRPG